MSYGKVNKTTGERIPYAGNSGGGTSDYTDLTNKPSINNVTLSGNKTASDLSLAPAYETITYAQWQAMTPAQQAAKDYYISNYPSSQIIAGNVSYSNTSSGMSANNVQGAVDELASEKKDEYTPITYAQWSALTPTQKAAKDYYISDYPSSAITAGNVSYNNSSSGMSANDVQGAVDELKNGLTNETTLLRQQLTTTATKYDLSGLVGDYMFIAIMLGWYDGDTNDNMIVMPSSAFLSNDYLLMYRKNDPSTNSYAKINSRGYLNGVNYINAEGTEGVSVKVVGIIHK